MPKISAATHRSLKVKDMWFNITKTSSAAERGGWIEFAELTNRQYDTDGLMTFESFLRLPESCDSAEVWVAFVANQPITDPSNISKEGIEMYISVTTSQEALFTTHMGIQRARCENPHKNISVLLHQFCANFISDIYPDKLTVISAPTDTMREILIKAFAKEGKSHSMHLQGFNEPMTSEELETMKSVIEKARESGQKLKPYYTAKFYSQNHKMEQKEAIANGSLYPGIVPPAYSIQNPKTGDLIQHIDKETFPWFFAVADLCTGAPMVSMVLKDLATITPNFLAECEGEDAAGGEMHLLAETSAAAHD